VGGQLLTGSLAGRPWSQGGPRMRFPRLFFFPRCLKSAARPQGSIFFWSRNVFWTNFFRLGPKSRRNPSPADPKKNDLAPEPPLLARLLSTWKKKLDPPSWPALTRRPPSFGRQKFPPRAILPRPFLPNG